MRSSSIRAHSRAFAAGLVVATAAFVAGCSQDAGGLGQGTGASAVPGAGNSGSISFDLTTPAGMTFTGFSYAIVGPNFSKGGAIDVSHSTTVSALIDDLPPGSGYTMTLLGTSAPPNVSSCSGSAPFDVVAGEVTSLAIALSCRVEAQPPPPVPLPPYAPVLLGFVLLALGTLTLGRRREAT